MSETKELIDREGQLREWVESYRTELLKLCIVYLSDWSLAEDAVQETFLKAWRSKNRFEARNGSSPKTWLSKIAINTCRSYRRTKWFRHADCALALETAISRLGEMQPEERDLLIDVSRLPEKYKSVILLYYYQEMTQQEIADVLGISRSAVNYRLQRALGMLRLTFRGEGHV